MSNELRALGHIPSKSDPRDYQHPINSSITAAVPLPRSYYVLNQAPIQDQGQTPTCVGHALAGMMEQSLISKGFNRILSVLAGYVGARSLEHPAPPEGTSIRDALIFAQKYGIPPEEDWPFLLGLGQPNASAANDALLTRVGGWAVVNNQVSNIKNALIQTQSNLIVALDVTPGFDSPGPDGVMRAGGDSRGSHAVNIAGWDEDKQCFLIRNSWGTGWGNGGYAWRPYTMYFTEIYTATVVALDTLPIRQLSWWQQLLGAFGIH